MPEIQDRIYPDSVKAAGITELRMHIYRYNWALQHTFAGGKTLDAGCGSGYGSRMLSFISSKVVAIDRAESAINHAKQRFPSEKIDYQVGNVLALQEKDFDTIVAFEMLEHNPDPEEVLQHLMSKLKGGRQGIFSLPVNSKAAGHLSVFTMKEIREFFGKWTKHLFYQNFGDLTMTPIENAFVVIALIGKK